MSTEPESDPFEWADSRGLESPHANQRRNTLAHTRIRNNDEPDELVMIPEDATEEDLMTQWVSASGEESFTGLEEAR